MRLLCGWNFLQAEFLAAPRTQEKPTRYGVPARTSCSTICLLPTYLSRLPLQFDSLLFLACQKSTLCLNKVLYLMRSFCSKPPPPSAIHVSSATRNQLLSGIRRRAPVVLCSLPPLGMRSASADWARCISYLCAILSEDFFLRCTRAERTNDHASCDPRLANQTHTSACVATKAIRKCRPRNGALLQVHSHP